MTTQQKTVGEIFDERGPCELMVKVVELATALKRMPVGEWDHRFQSDPAWRLCINGGEHDTWTPPDALAIKRFESYVSFNGWPAASFNTVDGCVIGVTEDQVIAAFDREIQVAEG